MDFAGNASNLKRLNVLTLDGGGIRGISSLLILQDLMGRINARLQELATPENPYPELQPHDVFELVAGTSTGGLIAIMLGKLGMSLEECIIAYDELSTKIFRKKHKRARLTFGLAPAKYSGRKLRDCVQDLLKRRNLSQDLPIDYVRGVDKIPCAVVCREHENKSKYSDYLDDAAIICSLRCDCTPECLVYEAARATSAAPTFFPIQKIGDRCFADGGIAFNNPSEAIYHHYTRPNNVAESCRTSAVTDMEVEEVVCHGDLNLSLLRIINLGTGTKPNISKTTSHSSFAAKITPPPFKMAAFLKRTLTRTATNSEKIAEHMRTIAQVSRGRVTMEASIKYERFSENTGTCFIELDEYREIDEIKRKTIEYLKTSRVKRDLERVANDIAGDYHRAQQRPSTLAVPDPRAIRSQSSASQLRQSAEGARVSNDQSESSAAVSSDPSREVEDPADVPATAIPPRVSSDISGPAESLVGSAESVAHSIAARA